MDLYDLVLNDLSLLDVHADGLVEEWGLQREEFTDGEQLVQAHDDSGLARSCG